MIKKYGKAWHIASWLGHFVAFMVAAKSTMVSQKVDIPKLKVCVGIRKYMMIWQISLKLHPIFCRNKHHCQDSTWLSDEDTKTQVSSQVLVGLVTRAQAKRFKEELNSLVHKVLKQEETVVLLIKVD